MQPLAQAVAATGDIWLFRGTSLGDRTIRSLETVFCAELVAATYQHRGCSRPSDRRARMTGAVLER